MADSINLQKLNPQNRFLGKFTKFTALENFALYCIILYQCTLYMYLHVSPPNSTDINYFWKWTDFREYLIFTGLFSLVGFIVTLLLINVSVFVELLGFASLFTEAMLGLPQFWRNYKHKSTEGMR